MKLTYDKLCNAVTDDVVAELKKYVPKEDGISTHDQDIFRSLVEGMDITLHNGDVLLAEIAVYDLENTDSKLIRIERFVDSPSDEWRDFYCIAQLASDGKDGFLHKPSLGINANTFEQESGIYMTELMIDTKKLKSKALIKAVNEFKANVCAVLDIGEIKIVDSPVIVPIKVPDETFFQAKRDTAINLAKQHFQDAAIVVNGKTSNLFDALNLRSEGMLFSVCTGAVISPIRIEITNHCKTMASTIIERFKSEKQAVVIKEKIGSIWGKW